MAPFSSLPAFLLLLAGLCLAEVISLRQSNSIPQIAADRTTDLSLRVRSQHNKAYSFAPGPSAADESELLDVVLVASVDGKLHALNRSSGAVLWSMSSSLSATVPATLGPLIRTQHPKYDPETQDDTSPDSEIYVIEPQSGEIYVMSSPTSPLQRLPFSMPQLVDMSPFSFSSEGDDRVFVGKKETSLLLVELETGRIKATLNAECPWDPFEDISENMKEYDDLDLDELEGDTPPRPTSKPTEVFIGRTDYHISIYTHPIRTPVHNLSFSTYGPNNQDHGLQSLYRRTADDRYIESLPTGKILSFRANVGTDDPGFSPNDRYLWGHSFPNPVVAVFDVLKSPNRQHPFVLLQPRPRIEDILPSAELAKAAKRDELPNLKSAYVGLVEETGSLYAMSPDRFPLVIFGDANADADDHNTLGRSIDPPPPGTPWDIDLDSPLPSSPSAEDMDLPPDVDSVARKMKLRQLCRNGSRDIRCLTGVKRLESSSMSRLLDGAPTIPYPAYHNANTQEQEHMAHNHTPGRSGDSVGLGNTSLVPPRPGGGLITAEGSGETRLTGLETTSLVFSVFAAAVAVVGLITAVVWFGFRRGAKHASGPPVPPKDLDLVVGGQPNGTPYEPVEEVVPTPSEVHLVPLEEKTPSLSMVPVEPALPSPPTPLPKKITFRNPPPSDPLDQDDPAVGDNNGGGDGDESEGDAPTTPGKR